jgi:hypothetical protein
LARLRLILSPKLQGESGQPGLGSSRPNPIANPSKRGAFRKIFNWTRQMREEGVFGDGGDDDDGLGADLRCATTGSSSGTFLMNI